MTQKDNNQFVQEYLYIEEPSPQIMEAYYMFTKEKDSDESVRGVVVIDLLGDEEE